MAFTLIDLEAWGRREYYEHFINEVRCSYSTTVNLDITNLKGRRLYPAMIWLLTQTVNQMPEFRTALTDEGLGIYDQMHPSYTVFRACLKIGGMPNGERFFRQSRQIFAGGLSPGKKI